MKERPIPFTGESVRAILDGRKTQTRRVVVPQPETRRDLLPTETEDIMEDRASRKLVFAIRTGTLTTRCLGSENFAREFSPYGQPGDRLWVRETFARLDGHPPENVGADAPVIAYRADDSMLRSARWSPWIHMPRWASRITLEITGVRVERVKDISYSDVLAEGCPTGNSTLASPDDFLWYECYWNTLNAKRGYGWSTNPWVWVIEFERLTERMQVAA